ncbi:Mitochondrial glutamate--tRNA ligase, partial [Lachnellula suecica]
MRLILSSARSTLASRWVCQSCRGRAVKYASTDAAVGKSLEPASAAQGLRERGPARTRFAPSPTGYLHLGSLRTALFNYLVAKATGGQFLLRIEDTDQKRTVPDAEERLYKDLEWAGIEWDEGPTIGGPYGPYKQSQRTAIYREHAEKLLHSGSAYRCFCSPERLHTLAEHRQKQGQPPDYDRTCAHIPKEHSDDRASKGEAHVIRLKVPNKYPVYKDLIYGLVRQRGDSKLKGSKSVNLGSYEDPILLKSDGFPTYHLANVVDDHLMKITDVIRGSEWMSSTPKHLALYEAFGWQPPSFAHVSLLVDKDGAKLSKRTGSIDLAEWRDKKGIFPETLTNFVSLLGWSHKGSNDVMGIEDLIRNASMKFTKGDTIVAFEKLWFLQKRHALRYASLDPSTPITPRNDLNKLALEPLVKYIDERNSQEPLPFYESLSPGTSRTDFVRSLLWADAQNYTTPFEFLARNISFFIPPTKATLASTIPTFKLRNVPEGIKHDIAVPLLLDSLDLYTRSSSLTTNWSKEKLKKYISKVINERVEHSISEAYPDSKDIEEAVKGAVSRAWGRLVHGYVRWAIAAGKPGPDGSVSMSILGREETLRRLKLARSIVMGPEDDEEAAAFAPSF